MNLEFPYAIEDGARHEDEPIPFGEGLTSQVIETRKPLLLGSSREVASRAAMGARACFSVRSRRSAKWAFQSRGGKSRR